eukprot:CAMPEP_0194782912 /NCGR_PEP_ID=MMETSP0323_2-20130528/78936_1 /TAXON_ID=2866 ORGANISM="Crypthecodinium cohnii, Strain Seligo" /NCGR_SAMPLE_ID=MMETSP0323_2 /ASSEMBLY_ACC=CAM_ASM_000346 /LENGTH=319 /DNA_ID=CAMNT_0039721753 /DNA_START=48 /DNA_END=1006 /DNA_ORIENTATION=+
MSCPKCPGPRVPHRCGKRATEWELAMASLKNATGRRRSAAVVCAFAGARSVLPPPGVSHWPLAQKHKPEDSKECTAATTPEVAPQEENATERRPSSGDLLERSAGAAASPSSSIPDVTLDGKNLECEPCVGAAESLFDAAATSAGSSEVALEDEEDDQPLCEEKEEEEEEEEEADSEGAAAMPQEAADVTLRKEEEEEEEEEADSEGAAAMPQEAADVTLRICPLCDINPSFAKCQDAVARAPSVAERALAGVASSLVAALRAEGMAGSMEGREGAAAIVEARVFSLLQPVKAVPAVLGWSVAVAAAAECPPAKIALSW